MVTAAKTMRTLAHAGCGLSPAEAAEAGNLTNCFDSYWIFVLLFGALQLVLSQAPSLENLAAASVIGAVASFGYAFIAFVMACAFAPRPPLGSVLGQPVSVWKDLNAVGNILFAFSFSFMLIEIQDTMKGDGERGPVRPMKKAVNIALAIMGSFYLAVALSGEELLTFFLSSSSSASSSSTLSLTKTKRKNLSFLSSLP
jgi:proton-coupled amino acid transporter